MLVDVVVKNGEIIAAKPNGVMPPPITLVTLAEGVTVPAINWPGTSTSGLTTRLANRIYGRLKGKALEKALNVVMDNGTLNISGEYGSIEISKREFKVDLELQKQFTAPLSF